MPGLDALAELQKYPKIQLDPAAAAKLTASPHIGVLTQITNDFEKMARHQFKLEQQCVSFKHGWHN